MAQNFNDYEELLKIFEEEPKRKSSDVQKPNTEKSVSTEEKKVSEERRNRVSNFKLNIDTNSSDEPPRHRGVYFSNPPKNLSEKAEEPQRIENERPAEINVPSEKTPAPYEKVGTPPASEAQQRVLEIKKMRKAKRKAAFKKFKRSNKSSKGKKGILNRKNLSNLLLYIAIIAFFSVVLCVYGIGCINDIFALNTDTTPVEITISDGMTDNQVISILRKNNLIKHSGFCKFFIKIIHITDSEKYEGGDYVSGIYTLSSDMGLEKMLSTLQSDITLSETVSLTFPEGYTIDQIAEKLEANEVCSATSFINTIKSVDLSGEYSFITTLDNKEERFRLLEGYIYPDTYDFYIGENPSSVVRRFLDNFTTKWNENYKELAEKSGMSMNEIITMASIIQKEAADSSQMGTISSILYNRLDSDNFQWLQCDSTETYLLKTIKPTLTSSTEDTEKYLKYRDNYDTYSTDCTGLPIGPICNPGDAAIMAVLEPEDTDYFYFRHDEDGKVYYAETLAEHEENERKAESND